MKKCNFWLTKQQQQWRLSCKRIRQWQHILVSITSNPSKTTRVWTTFRESGKNGSIHVSLQSLIFYVMINEFFWYLKQKSRRLLHFVQQTNIVIFLLLFGQYGVKILITSFWDTQYVQCLEACSMNSYRGNSQSFPNWPYSVCYFKNKS